MSTGATSVRRAPYLFALLLAAHSLGWTQNFPETEIRTVPVRGNIFMLQGVGGNIAVSTGSDGTLIVDDEYSTLTDRLVAAIAALADRPVEFVVNTHWHHDHTEGNEYFGRAAALIVAQVNSRVRMSSEQFISLDRSAQAPYAEVGLPKITFTESLRFHYNDDTIDLIHFGPAHTDGDAVVFFRERNVLHSGDLFVGYRFRPPYIDQPNGGSTDGMIEATRALARLIDDDAIIIPGHGDLASRADLLEYLAMLITVRDRIREAIARGESEDEVVVARPTSEFAIQGRGTDRWVRATYQEYR